ncbi:MAG: helix-turn-helix domain-containing protein, partial [Planctomycetota bacterium]|nr:helix-turn-helix domain-containing protein [Planctomycetota bacterium]
MRPARPVPPPPGFDLLATPPRVSLANFYPFEPGEVAGQHWSESNLFLPCTNGTGEIQVGPRRFTLQAGQIMHVPWAGPIVYRADRRDPFVVIGLHFFYRPWSDAPVPRPHHVSRRVDLTRVSNQAPPSPQPFSEPFVLAPPPESRLLDWGSEIARAYSQADGVAEALREARLRAMALAFLADFQAAARGSGSAHGARATAAQARVVREISSWMELSLRRAIKRGELAERAGISESGLADAFRAVTGRAPIDYLIDLRLAHARRMLRSGRERVGAIAARVGIP